ncbi:transporter substrate-binding domain-containing protein [Endozoicomonas sp. SM1973]|uniref:Transporter substrate-binding domain-containing protein n=1 Tax=Spartinivicinus marinus TaxID=2994442 RepID=A0A853IF30_9GAMM|nr:transporter substrate-binding domain-containing protein [Spartinivicinus marinus]NYZ66086.1 transporter substrate-binding domain-containing protein [Spartinivicinus marinus]
MPYKVIALLIYCLFATSSLSYSAPFKIATFHFPPYEYTTDEGITGISVDIVKAVFKEMEVEFKLIELPWSRGLRAIKKGNIDCFFEVLWKQEREAYMDYAKEVLMPETASFFVLAKSSIQFTRGFSSLAQYKIGMRQDFSYGSSFDKSVDSNQFKIIIKRTKNEDLLRMLNTGEIDLLIGDKYGILYLYQRTFIRHKHAIKRLKPDVEDTPSYMVFTKQHDLSALRDQFTKALRQFKADGRYQRIINRWEKILQQNIIENTPP